MAFVALIFYMQILSAYGAGVFTVPLDPGGSFTLHWRLDYDSSSATLELHSIAPPPLSWLALGFSDYGDIANADLCLFWTDWRGRSHLQDGWTDEDGIFHVDSQQDCARWRHRLEGKIMKLVFTRSFDTCDKYDYIIEEGTTHVVWASGAGPLFRSTGLDVSTGQHGFQRTQLLKNPRAGAEAEVPAEAWNLTVTEEDNHVPGADTTYWCRVVPLPPQLSAKHHIVKFEAVVSPGNEPLVHHMELFHCEAPSGEEMPLYRGPCDSAERPPATQVCKRVMAAWAMGATPFYFPQEAGLPVGGEDYNLYAMLEIHYNNPEVRSDWVDSSGINVMLTSALRPHDAGVIELGLEYIDKMAIPPGQPHFSLSGYCVSECTGVSLPPSGVLVFGSQLHTHLTGVGVTTHHVREGRELPELNRDDHYSTHFQEIRLLKRPVTVLPGDALITTCWYNTAERDNVTLGGFAITDEMCVNYIYYYPKTSLEVCKSSISDQSLQTYFRQVHEWEDQDTSPELGVSANYGAIEWTPARAAVLHELYRQAPVSMQCNQSSGARFPGDWSSLPVTPVLYPLPPPSRDYWFKSNLGR